MDFFTLDEFGKLINDFELTGVEDVDFYKNGSFTDIASETPSGFSFGITEEFKNDCFEQLNAKQKSMMFHYILKYKKDLIFCQEKENSSLWGEYKYIDFKELVEDYPINIAQRIKCILENLANYSQYIGSSFVLGANAEELEQDKKKYWLFMPEENRKGIAWGTYQMLLGAGYLGVYTNGTCEGDNRVFLTEKAWNYIVKAQKKKENKIFIAMSYKDDIALKKYEDKVKEVIRECGFKTVIIKDKEHNEYIPPEIEYEIATSAAVLADLTGQNNGVYFEAGYARGQNVPVIFTCDEHDDETQNVHFDVKQISMLFWNSEKLEDLHEKLRRRIKATVVQPNAEAK